MKPTVIIAAANGFIGRKLVSYLSENYHVIALVRTNLPDRAGVEYLIWDGRSEGEWMKRFEGAAAVINLAGKSVDCRYSEKNKAAIYSSRLESTRIIGKAIEQCKKKPEVWLNAASATIYAHSEQLPNTEENGIIGTGFSVDVCLKWEACFTAFKQPGTRQITLRTAIVLGREGGVMTPFKNLVKFGLGGKMGKGNQMFSWVHEDDVCRAIGFLIGNKGCSGIYNLAAPNPVTNSEFMRKLRKTMNASTGIPTPVWMLKTGAWLIGTETELVLKSRFVIPERLQQAGFQFRHGTIGNCLEDLIKIPNHGTFG